MNIKSKQFNALVQGSPYSVAVNGDLTFALRQWKKILKDTNIVKELFDRQRYTKPSDWKRIQRSEAIYKQSKENQ